MKWMEEKKKQWEDYNYKKITQVKMWKNLL